MCSKYVSALLLMLIYSTRFHPCTSMPFQAKGSVLMHLAVPLLAYSVAGQFMPGNLPAAIFQQLNPQRLMQLASMDSATDRNGFYDRPNSNFGLKDADRDGFFSQLGGMAKSLFYKFFEVLGSLVKFNFLQASLKQDLAQKLMMRLLRILTDQQYMNLILKVMREPFPTLKSPAFYFLLKLYQNSLMKKKDVDFTSTKIAMIEPVNVEENSETDKQNPTNGGENEEEEY